MIYVYRELVFIVLCEVFGNDYIVSLGEQYQKDVYGMFYMLLVK